MTSGNLSEEPIAKDNGEALKRLAGIADYFLMHNRDIYSRYDDSVAMVEMGTSQLIRRARGYAPHPIRLPFRTRLFHIEPEVVAHDLHPDYLATKYAGELGERGVKAVPVQHHHAHIASCLADNGVESRVIGVAFDGTGMGADGNDVIASLNKEKGKQTRLASIRQVSELETEVIKRQIERRVNSPLSSSMGRLFDAISALLGIKGEVDYEGQAAVELEMAAHSSLIAEPVPSRAKGLDKRMSDIKESYPYLIVEDKGMKIVHLRDLLSGVIEDLHQDVSQGMIAIKFHNTVAQMITEMCRLIADDTGIKEIALSGGVFQNRLLLTKTVSLLESSGFHVFIHRQVPCNDGGISLGQAVVANFA
jgi:hydrogenase maturation protein HypF